MQVTWRRCAACAVVIGVLLTTGCGGGGGGTQAPTETVPALPASVVITAPDQASWQTAVVFDSSLAATAGLRHEWRFGDGSTSTEARPSHTFAAAGAYDVTLVVSNALGASVTATKKLQIQAWANLRSSACSQPGVGGWCRIGQASAQAPVAAIDIQDATQASLVTTFGEVWRTVDAGKTWQRLAAAGPDGAVGVHFVDANTGWIVAKPIASSADEPLFWRTADGGASFAPVLPDQPAGLRYGIRHLGGKLLLAEAPQPVGGVYPSLGSVDGGATWRANPASAQPWVRDSTWLASSGRTGRMWRFAAGTLEVSDDAGLTSRAVGTLPASCRFDGRSLRLEVSAAGTLLKASEQDYVNGGYLLRACYSLDGGTTWLPALPSQTLSTSWFGNVAFIADQGLSVVDVQGNLWLSLPAGASWQQVALDPAFATLALTAVDSQRLWAELDSGRSLFGTPGPQILFSDDAGKHWTGYTPASPDVTRSFRFRVNSSLGGFVLRNAAFDSSRGLQLRQDQLFRTEDNGSSWAAMNLTGTAPLPAQAGQGVFLNVRQGFVVSSEGQLLRSDDGGQTWTVSDALPGGSIVSIWSGPEQSLWVHGRFLVNQAAFEGRLMRSLDAGKSWTVVWQGDSVQDLQFTDRTRGWFRTNDTVYRSSDFGLTWQAVGTLGTARMRFLDANRGIAGFLRYQGSSQPGLECLQTTSDGGATWSACEVPQVASGGGLLGVAAGASSFWLFNSAGAHRSTDFGKTWTRVSLPGASPRLGNIADVAFADARRGWMVGGHGSVWTTQDGGLTWALQPTPTSTDLKRLSVVDARAVWAFGAKTVLGTATAGD